MADPRAALAVLVNAFERHLEACSQRRGEDDPSVLAAYDDLADAFEAYDDALLDAFGEMTPFDVVSEPDEDDDAGLEDDGDADGRYLGLDDEEFDEDDLDESDDEGDDEADEDDLDDDADDDDPDDDRSPR
ncbi:MAG: hypothetical protein IPH03_13250 [Tetrasphaera sp.]|jgi:hypothetical protein|nr:hypothetical protein [Tetrasphaera sp.]